MSIGIGLEVGYVTHRRIFMRKEAPRIFELLRDCSTADGRRKGVVIAIGTAPIAECTVAIGTGKAGVDGKFLHFAGEALGEVSGVIAIEHRGEFRLLNKSWR